MKTGIKTKDVICKRVRTYYRKKELTVAECVKTDYFKGYMQFFEDLKLPFEERTQGFYLSEGKLVSKTTQDFGNGYRRGLSDKLKSNGAGDRVSICIVPREFYIKLLEERHLNTCS